MRIEVDPIKCEAHGLCAELLPERITLDEWGYPLIDGTPVPRSLEDLARRAANACPTLALKLRASEGIDLDASLSATGRRMDGTQRVQRQQLGEATRAAADRGHTQPATRRRYTR